MNTQELLAKREDIRCEVATVLESYLDDYLGGQVWSDDNLHQSASVKDFFQVNCPIQHGQEV